MEFTFENQGTHTYLVYHIDENDIIDTMSLGMLTNNNIDGLTHTLYTQMDSSKFVKYDVSAKISVKQFFMGQVNKKRLIGVFNGIVNAMISAEEYMLDVNSLLLDLDYIFADVTTCETVMICLPVVPQNKIGQNLGAFFKDIMFSTQFDQTENCDHVAKIINYLNSVPVFSLEDFKNILDSISGNGQETAPVSTSVAQQPHVSKTTPVATQPPQSTVSSAGQQQTTALSQGAITNKPQAGQSQQPLTTQQVPQRQGGSVQPSVETHTPLVNTEIASAADHTEEKTMSLMYLLQHYSSENAELYKRQKEAKKNGKSVGAPVPPAAPSGDFGFSIPGQDAQPINKSTIGGFSEKTNSSNTEKSMQGIDGNSAMRQNQSGFNMNPSDKVYTPSAPATNSGITSAPASDSAMMGNSNNFAGLNGGQPTKSNTMQNSSGYSMSMPQGQSASFGDTTVLNNAAGKVGETTVLNMQRTVQQMPHLIRTKNQEKIPVDKPVFRIGKEKSYVDYFIGDNSAISRSHANLIIRENQYFVVDTNSTNHTYVDGTMIQSSVEIPISHGTKIKLANEEFEFRLF